jgi:hypothetical protein
VGFGNRMGDIQYPERPSRCDRQTPQLHLTDGHMWWWCGGVQWSHCFLWVCVCVLMSLP